MRTDPNKGEGEPATEGPRCWVFCCCSLLEIFARPFSRHKNVNRSEWARRRITRLIGAPLIAGACSTTWAIIHMQFDSSWMHRVASTAQQFLSFFCSQGLCNGRHLLGNQSFTVGSSCPSRTHLGGVKQHSRTRLGGARRRSRILLAKVRARQYLPKSKAGTGVPSSSTESGRLETRPTLACWR